MACGRSYLVLVKLELATDVRFESPAPLAESSRPTWKEPSSLTRSRSTSTCTPSRSFHSTRSSPMRTTSRCVHPRTGLIRPCRTPEGTLIACPSPLAVRHLDQVRGVDLPRLRRARRRPRPELPHHPLEHCHARPHHLRSRQSSAPVAARESCRSHSRTPEADLLALPLRPPTLRRPSSSRSCPSSIAARARSSAFSTSP